jgi:hypothetical protein
MFKINYLNPSNKNQSLLGRIMFTKDYQPPSVDFPYFYLNSQSETLNYANWPDLVPYLYGKTLGFFTIINNTYRFKDKFEVYSFFVQNVNQIVLKFINSDSIKALNALDEDKKLYFLENGNYTDWNRTVTPNGDFKTTDNVTFLNSNVNYKISDINIENDNLGYLTLIIANNQTYNEEQILNNRTVEFGLYRQANKSSTESVFYTGIKNKFFSTPNSNDLIGGLRVRSQIIGHTHEHVHTINHTHTMAHIHDLRNHVHYMDHQHGYTEIRSDAIPYGYAAFGGSTDTAGPPYTITRTTNYSLDRSSTDGPDRNTTGNASQSTTTIPSNNSLTSISAKTINNDNGLYTNSNKFKHGDKNSYDSIVYFAYMYGASYIVSS